MVQLQLQPEIEAQLAAEAEAIGLPIESLIQNTSSPSASPTTTSSKASTTSPPVAPAPPARSSPNSTTNMDYKG